VQAEAPRITVSAEVSAEQGWELPVRQLQALSTDAGSACGHRPA
jgi:hypothetical protein